MVTSYTAMGTPQVGFTSRRKSAYSACIANRSSVAGQIQSMRRIARPVTMLEVARCASTAGSTSNPARPVIAANGRGASRSCAIRPASTTSQKSSTIASASCATGSQVISRGTSLSALHDLCFHLARREAAAEHVECASSIVLGGREYIEQQKLADWKCVRGDVTSVEQQHRTHSLFARSDEGQRRRREPCGTSSSNE